MHYLDPETGQWSKVAGVSPPTESGFGSNGAGMSNLAYDDIHDVMVYLADGGKTWMQKKSPTKEKLGDVYFSDEKHGWIVGDKGVILQTTNGGSRWRHQSGGAEFSDLYSVFFLNEHFGATVGTSGVILYTTDGGRHWLAPKAAGGGSLNP